MANLFNLLCVFIMVFGFIRGQEVEIAKEEEEAQGTFLAFL